MPKPTLESEDNLGYYNPKYNHYKQLIQSSNFMERGSMGVNLRLPAPLKAGNKESSG